MAEQLGNMRIRIENSGIFLYDALKDMGITLNASCAGKGTCGACKIRVLQGKLPVTTKDRQFLSREQLEEGWRLACQAYLEESCEIFVPEENFAAVTNEECGNTEFVQSDDSSCQFIGKDTCPKAYGIAIDLGTTTLAYELFSLEDAKTCRLHFSTNPQRVYGADVVSRMEQSDNGRKELLKNILIRELREQIGLLIEGINLESIRKIGISGNTAMVHFLMGYSCEGLGRYPFAPVTLERIDTDALNMGLLKEPVPVTISPGISAYIGGDVLVGAAYKKILQKPYPCLFLDLGTNAEMLLTDGAGNVFVTSAPAGPAFEAANISCGVGSIAGAVSSVAIDKASLQIKTIQDQKPIGFCGSGILEAIYELRKNNIIDETGLLEDAYFENGYPVASLKITQQDVRQIQLAKSAVFSAIQILARTAGITLDQVKEAYLAGGFGYYLNIEKAIGIGLLPVQLNKRIKIAGNTSLYGTKQYLCGNLPEEEILSLKKASEEIYLSNDNEFQRYFMDNMSLLFTSY